MSGHRVYPKKMKDQRPSKRLMLKGWPAWSNSRGSEISNGPGNATKPRDLEEYEKEGLEDVSEEKDEETKARLKTYMFGLDLVLRDPIEL